MPKKGKKKVQTTGDDPEVEIVQKLEIIYEDTKGFTRADPKLRWGQVYQMIKDQVFLDVGLEDILVYANIMKSAIMKVSTRHKIFPCAEVIGWILPRADTSKMILSNTDGQGFTTYIPTYVAKACNLPTPQVYMT